MSETARGRVRGASVERSSGLSNSQVCIKPCSSQSCLGQQLPWPSGLMPIMGKVVLSCSLLFLTLIFHECLWEAGGSGYPDSLNLISIQNHLRHLSKP